LEAGSHDVLPDPEFAIGSEGVGERIILQIYTNGMRSAGSDFQHMRSEIAGDGDFVDPDDPMLM
jgi:hypothetical protein